jgi:hypothetical protein
MKIRMPRVRAYYPASQNEPEWLFCWIPPEELEQLATAGSVRSGVLEDHPSGLEVEVSQRGFREFDLDLGAEPAALQRAYETLRKMEALPESGIVAADQLEGLVRSADAGAGDLEAEAVNLASGEGLPEPEWTDGDDPRTAMRQL